MPANLSQSAWMKLTLEEPIQRSLRQQMLVDELTDGALSMKNHLRDGDELWFFRTPPETWTEFFPHCGLEGYVLLRNGRLAAETFTAMS